MVITGSDFSGVSAVTFGGTAATSFTVNSNTRITAKAPAHAAGTVQVIVTAGGGTSSESSASAYEYVAVPVISGLSVSSGPYSGGSTVVITGTDFTEVSGLVFGAARVSEYTVDSSTQITATSPSWWWGGVVQVKVTAVGGPSGYTANADFTYSLPIAAEEFVTTRLQTEEVEQYAPQIDGTRVVWQRFQGEDFDIMTWTPESGTVDITSNRHNDLDPQVSGDRVVWRGYDGNDYGIYTWTPTGGAVLLTTDSYDDYAPQVSGDRVAWIGMDATGTEYEIHTWTPTEGVTHLVTDECYQDDVQVDGDRVVWQSFEDASFEVYTWTPTEGVHQIKLRRLGRLRPAGIWRPGGLVGYRRIRQRPRDIHLDAHRRGAATHNVGRPCVCSAGLGRPRGVVRI